MDATKRLPFADNTFKYIFTEHMLEHIPILSAQSFLAECHRVLRKDGVVRISTPDLAFLIAVWSDAGSEFMRRYIQSASQHYNNYPDLTNRCTTINNFFYNWGHSFIFDEDSLRWLMGKVGFKEVVRCDVGESRHLQLQQLEKHGELIGREFNLFETMVLEGVKQ